MGSITCTWRAVMSVPSKITSSMSSTLNASVTYLPGRVARRDERLHARRARFGVGMCGIGAGRGGGVVLSALAPSKIAVGAHVAVHLGEFSLDDPREVQDQPEIVELEMERQGGYGRDEVGEADHREHP